MLSFSSSLRLGLAGIKKYSLGLEHLSGRDADKGSTMEEGQGSRPYTALGSPFQSIETRGCRTTSF
jgi:hypothetical protein